MRTYSKWISLIKNTRGVYSLDPTLGCNAGTKHDPLGCYSDCYAVKMSRAYGYDFSKTVLRYFRNESHRIKTIREIEKIPLPFVRMGTMGDPSEDWGHTLNICRAINTTHQFSLFNEQSKQIVIITRHWNTLTEAQLCELSGYNVCVNTSVSSLDKDGIREKCVNEFERLKPYCKSILRIVSADFNTDNPEGERLAKTQNKLFQHAGTLDTVLRVRKANPWVVNGIIKIKSGNFMGKPQYLSKFNKKTYVGKCSTCLEMCGVNI